MAEANIDFADRKLDDMMNKVIRVFDELEHFLAFRRKLLLDRLAKIRQDCHTNSEFTKAIKELSRMREGFRSNLLGVAFGRKFEEKINGFETSKLDTENFQQFGFRSDSERIRKAIDNIDLFELSAEYVGRENHFLTACYRGDGMGELQTPRGIDLDRAREEVYVCDSGNNRIQVLKTIGVYIRQFASYQLIEPHAICLSQQDELFVTDVAKQCVMKFSFAGDFIAQTGSKGNEVEQFTGIAGLCCEPDLVYICDSIVERVQIFDSNLNYIKEFGHGQLIRPTDVKILSENAYILSQNGNCIYCYNTYCVLEKKIELTGHEHLMTDAIFFAIDREGNFLITDLILQQILVFSTKGVLRIILHTANLPLGIVIDNFDKVICVCHSKECFLKF